MLKDFFLINIITAKTQRRRENLASLRLNGPISLTHATLKIHCTPAQRSVSYVAPSGF